MTQGLPDAAIRQEITGRLDRTLFVEAGAGSGKTQSLVDRVVATVLSADQAVPLRHVAAVTFTEKAGAELRDRLRVAFETGLFTAQSPGLFRGRSHPAGRRRRPASAQPAEFLHRHQRSCRARPNQSRSV